MTTAPLPINKMSERSQNFLVEARRRARHNKSAFDTFKALLKFALKSGPLPNKTFTTQIVYIESVLKVLETHAPMIKQAPYMQKYVTGAIDTIRSTAYPVLVQLLEQYDGPRTSRAKIADAIREMNNRMCSVHELCVE